MAVLHGQQGGIEGLGRGLGGLGARLDSWRDAALRSATAVLRARRWASAQSTAEMRQGDRARRRRQDQFVRAHPGLGPRSGESSAARARAWRRAAASAPRFTC